MSAPEANRSDRVFPTHLKARRCAAMLAEVRLPTSDDFCDRVKKLSILSSFFPNGLLRSYGLGAPRFVIL